MQQRVLQIAEGAVCAGLLVLAAVWMYGGAWRSGAVPMDLSSALTLTPWQEAQPAGAPPVVDQSTLAQAQRYFPWYVWMNRGGAILWDDAEGLGVPFMAAWRTRALSPFSLPLYAVPLQHALVLSALLKMLVAGLCAYYASRRFEFPAATSFLAAVTYALGAPFLVYSPAPVSDIVAWLPLLLVSAERLVLGRFTAWPLAALVLALMALGGDPHGIAVVMLIFLIYVGVRAAQDVRAPSTLGAVLAAGASIAVAGGLVAVQLLPYREFTDQADTLLGPELRLRVSDLFAVLHPALASGEGHTNPALASLLHVGLVPLLLLPLWFAVREFSPATRRGHIETLLVIAVVLSVGGIAAGPWLRRLQEIEGPGPEHFLYFNALAFALMAAAAAQEWIELTVDEARVAVQRLLRLLPVVWGAILAAAIAGAVISGAWWSFGVVLIAALVVFVLMAVALVRPNARVLSYGLALTSALSLVACFHGVRPMTPAEQVFPETTVVKSLQRIAGRVGGSDRLAQWPVGVNGVQQVFDASGLLLNRLREFLARVEQDPLLMRRTGAQGLLLTTADIRGPFAGVRPVLSIREVFASGAILFQDNAALPRARMIYAGHRIDKYAPDQVRSDGPPVLESSTLPEKDDGPVAKVAIAEDTPTRITFKVDKTRPAVLVLADAWYPGWRATVDGNPAEVVRVDGLFRGVELGEGEHEVVLEYVPASLRWGLGISVVSGLIFAAGLWGFARSKGITHG